MQTPHFGGAEFISPTIFQPSSDGVSKHAFFTSTVWNGNSGTEPPYFGGVEFIYAAISHHSSTGRQKMRFCGSRLLEFLSLHVHSLPQYRNWLFSLPRAGRAIRGCSPPILGALNSCPRLFCIHQAMGRQKMCFYSYQTGRFSVYLPSSPPYRKWGFSPSQSGRAIWVRNPPILGALISFMRLFLLSKSTGASKNTFSRSTPTEFPCIPPRPTVRKMGSFSFRVRNGN